ncbi:hypothetical protein ADL03_42125 [Nocardia sp. NRRL S-836]|nr:hypothetical protein ADL03_42125 [Nocardia sp. NRRL S-836]
MPEPDLIWHQFARPGLLGYRGSLRTPVVTVREFSPNGLPHRRVRTRATASRAPAREARPPTGKGRPWPAGTR